VLDGNVSWLLTAYFPYGNDFITLTLLAYINYSDASMFDYWLVLHIKHHIQHHLRQYLQQLHLNTLLLSYRNTEYPRSEHTLGRILLSSAEAEQCAVVELSMAENTAYAGSMWKWIGMIQRRIKGSLFSLC